MIVKFPPSGVQIPPGPYALVIPDDAPELTTVQKTGLGTIAEFFYRAGVAEVTPQDDPRLVRAGVADGPVLVEWGDSRVRYHAMRDDGNIVTVDVTAVLISWGIVGLRPVEP